jgi:hypothetical protein
MVAGTEAARVRAEGGQRGIGCEGWRWVEGPRARRRDRERRREGGCREQGRGVRR